MLQREEILTLDNNKEYVVVSTLDYDNSYYVYLINIKDKKDFMFCKYENNELIKITEDNLVERLMHLFIGQMS